MARTLKEYPSVLLKSEEIDNRIDFVRIFGRTGPVHIEIGSGKGTFLINQARARPGDNFLGIEWARKYYRYAIDRIGRWGLTNVRIIRTDAAVFLADFITDSSVECFHIYFPDPWPKKRHHKRRFISPANLEHLIRCLKTGGQLKIATDHEDYFQVIQELITDQDKGLEEIQFLPTAGADKGEWVGTNFERKYLKDQRSIYTIAVKKI
ncbi:MAG: tRNA (guanosine(46)-N7)-methyltransferase TrmB [Planctomycetes bacterium]|nr:tRNA (guanosine(46)-N7)-methyltransferase TrmB [Planctomycetota bacterium]MBL7143912.1 tRNA (guanosine(46)-N7)-methyltransferase TrmB [Phycisphaerae bacterium]